MTKSEKIQAHKLSQFTYIFIREKDSVAILLENEFHIVTRVGLIVNQLSISMMSVSRAIGMILVMMVIINEEEHAHVTEQRELHRLLQ